MLRYVAKKTQKISAYQEKRVICYSLISKTFLWEEIQYSSPGDKYKQLDLKGIQRVHSVGGTFLYNTRVVDLTILPAINEVGMMQSNRTKKLVALSLNNNERK